MLERNEKGKEIRKYFIEIEKRAKQIQNQIALPTTYKEALKSLLNEIEEKEKLLLENETLNSTISVLSTIHEVEHDLRGLQECGTHLNLHPNKFINKLKELQYLKKGTPLLPYQECINEGLFVVKVICYKYYKDDTLNEKATPQTFITKKGFIHFEKLIAKNPQEWSKLANVNLKQAIIKN